MGGIEIRHAPRPRRQVRPATLKLVRFVGFRYDASRDAYVLRLVGNRIGPVLKTSPPVDSAAAAMEWPAKMQKRRAAERRERPAAERRRTGRFVPGARTAADDSRQAPIRH